MKSADWWTIVKRELATLTVYFAVIMLGYLLLPNDPAFQIPAFFAAVGSALAFGAFLAKRLKRKAVR